MNLCDIISEAKCCAGKMAAKYATVKTFGNKDDRLFYDLLRLNVYIKTLERNQVVKRTIKTKISSSQGNIIDFSSLKKQNNVLVLETKEGISCTTVEISPCLSDSEICKILEQLRKMCSGCNCNC